MPDFVHDTSWAKDLDPSGRLGAWMERVHQAVNNLGKQTNAAPVGSSSPPPAPSAVTVKAFSTGAHQVDVHDNNQVNRGIIYNYEFSDNPQFTSPILYQSTPSKSIVAQVGAGPRFWKVTSQYIAAPSGPSEPAFLGTAVTPGSVDAGGNPTIAVIGMGSGTEPILQPQSGAGFGFDPVRNKSGVLPRE